MTLKDPLTGEKLDLYCTDGDSEEIDCYRANEEKAIAVIQRDKRVDKNEAIRLLENSDIFNPVICDDCEFWVE